jgi:hypothetical protein
VSASAAYRVALGLAVAVDGSDNSGNEDGTSNSEASGVGWVACAGGWGRLGVVCKGAHVSTCTWREYVVYKSGGNWKVVGTRVHAIS